MDNINKSVLLHFVSIMEKRQEYKIKHNLMEIIFIVLVCTIAGCDDWQDIELFAKEREEWFKKHIELPNGIPSHDTIERVFRWIEPKQFEKCFICWTNGFKLLKDRQTIAIDGKTCRGSSDKSIDRSAIHMVSAWACENSLILGQVKTAEKSNEITAIPELLDLISVKNNIITIDAMGTQKDIAKKIIEKKGDYVLALKGNQSTLQTDVIDYFKFAISEHFKDIDYKYYRTLDKGHGRVEKRKYYLINDINWLNNKENWAGLEGIGMVESTVMKGELQTVETRYFITSLTGTAEEFGNSVRNHWGIESMHWMLDVVFKEDKNHVRKDFAPQNLAVLRRIALNILKKDTSIKKSLKIKRFKAALNLDYLTHMVFDF
jgi:predicted transposase YbfD/YdcC